MSRIMGWILPPPRPYTEGLTQCMTALGDWVCKEAAVKMKP